MKSILFSLGCALALYGTFAYRLALADEKSPLEPLSAEVAEMMKKAEMAGTPGEEHQLLEPLIGEWTAEIRSWITPSGPPVMNQGTAKAEWTMKGRFVREEFSGEIMGRPFQGMSLTGYDKQKKQYVGIWVDDMSTAIIKSEGTAAEDGKLLTLLSKMDCAVTGEKDMPIRQVIRIVSDDEHVLEMYATNQGKEAKTMEITYTRK